MVIYWACTQVRNCRDLPAKAYVLSDLKCYFQADFYCFITITLPSLSTFRQSTCCPE